MDPIGDFAREVVEHVSDDTEAEAMLRFDPITLMILFAVVSAVVSHYVAKWLDQCDAKSVREPNVFQRWKLRRAIRSELAVSRRPELAAVAVAPVSRAILASLAARDEHEIRLALATFRQHLGLTENDR